MTASLRASVLVCAALAGGICAVWLNLATRASGAEPHRRSPLGGEGPFAGPFIVKRVSLPPADAAPLIEKPLPMPSPPPARDDRRAMIVIGSVAVALVLTGAALATIPRGEGLHG